MKNFFASSPFHLFLCAVLMLRSTFAFEMRNARTTMNRPSALPSSTVNQDLLTGNNALLPDMTSLPTWDLPKNSQILKEKSAEITELLDLEVAIGRIAMLAATFFFVNEVTTGQSLPEQLSSLGIFH